MNVRLQINHSAFSGGQSLLSYGGTKSAQEKKERQAQCDQQIAFFEQQKSNLKTMQCDTVDAIAMKLEMLEDYNEQITAAKNAYNNEQMFHIMDEARERGEQIAKQAEKMKPKTEEERREEAIEQAKEALGAEESDGLLEELLEEATDMMEELNEESVESLEEAVELEEQAQEAADDLESESNALQQTMQINASDQQNIVDRYVRLLEDEQAALYEALDMRA